MDIDHYSLLVVAAISFFDCGDGHYEILCHALALLGENLQPVSQNQTVDH